MEEEILKILVVLKNETPEELRDYEMVDTSLRERGFEVFITSSGFTAIQEMRGDYPLVIVQIDTFGIGGLELLQTAKMMDEETQVLIVSDKDHLSETMETLRLGAYDYLLKPITDVSELVNKVENAKATRDLTRLNKKLVNDLKITNESLKKAKDEIEAWNRTLENRVKERTSELEQSKNKIQQINIELQKANAELRKLDKLKSDFMANVSHELRTPVTAIKGFTELLIMYPDADKAQIKEFSAMIHSETEKLVTLINGVVELTELDSMKLNWEAHVVSIPEIIRSVLDNFEDIVKQKNIKVETKFDENIPFIKGHSEKLQIAFRNLIDNAIKFNKNPGYISLNAKLVKKDSKDWIRCDVIDHGIGIPKENWDGVFDRFRQGGDILTDKPSGMGLGLPIVKEIIIHHDGLISLYSEVGKGSDFKCMFPVKPI